MRRLSLGAVSFVFLEAIAFEVNLLWRENVKRFSSRSFAAELASQIELAMAFGLHEERRRHYGDDIQISVTHGPDRYCRHTRAAVFAVRPATKSRHDR